MTLEKLNLSKIIITSLFLILFSYFSSSQCTVPSGGFSFTTQAQIDNFHANNPNCDSIPGSLTISGNFSEPTNLNGLLGIEYIQDDLTLNGVSGISNLHGLDSLKEVGGDLSIWFSPQLNNLEGLGELKKINGDFSITENSASGSIGTAGMENLIGIQSLDTIVGNLDIAWNQLDSYHGLDSLKYIGGLTIANNNNTGQTPYDTTLNGLQNLSDFLNGSLTIKGSNLGITSIDSLDILHEIKGDLVLESLNVSDFSRLDSIQQILGQFVFKNNFNASSLPAFLENLNSIDTIVITGNPLITHLNELNALNSISGNLWISSNAVLNDISSLDGVDFSSLTELRIINNPLLSVCATVCSYLTDPTNTSFIFDNAIGCNSSSEIIDSCSLNVTTLENPKNKVIFYPNPVRQNSEIYFSQTIISISIYSSDMKLILSRNEINSNEITLPNLSKGLYFIKINNTKPKVVIVK